MAEHRHVLTEVRAMVHPSREDDFVARFQAMLAGPRPDGLLRTELLHTGGEWRVQTLWRDRQALEAMRAGSDEPAAPALFRSVGSEPELTVLEVVVTTAG
jgi:heme-degrading monooxygenase HmoA